MEEHNQKKVRPEIWWFLTDKWFRLLEFSLILGTLYYFSNKTDFVLLKIIYWISWFFLYSWFMEMAEYIPESYFGGSSLKKKLLIWSISTIIVIIFYTIITLGTQRLVEQQFGQ